MGYIDVHVVAHAWVAGEVAFNICMSGTYHGARCVFGIVRLLRNLELITGALSSCRLAHDIVFRPIAAYSRRRCMDHVTQKSPGPAGLTVEHGPGSQLGLQTLEKRTAIRCKCCGGMLAKI